MRSETSRDIEESDTTYPSSLNEMATSIVNDTDERGGSAAADQRVVSPHILETNTSTQTLTLRVQEPSLRLLDLPPELGILICRFAVIKGKISIRNADRANEVAHAVAQPALSRTCKTLRKEALEAFYAGNEFSFRDSRNVHSGLTMWLRALGPESAALVKNCSIISAEDDVVTYVIT